MAEEGYITPTPLGDPFRQDYGKLETYQIDDMKILKFKFAQIWRELDALELKYGTSRDLAVARTELQTSCMWAIRAVTKTGDQT